MCACCEERSETILEYVRYDFLDWWRDTRLLRAWTAQRYSVADECVLVVLY